MSNYGLKVSQAGYDVKTATPTQLVFSSAFSTFNIVAQGTLSHIVPASGDYSFVIAHGLSYIPYVLGYYTETAVPNYWRWCPCSGEDFLLNETTATWGPYVDSTNVTFRFDNVDSADQTVTLKYYIFNVAI